MFASTSRIAARREIDIHLLRRSATVVVNRTHSTQAAVTQARPFEEIPGIRTIPFIGSTWKYFPIIGKYNFSKIHHADLAKNQEYGDLVREKFGILNIVSCYRPENIETVFREEGKYPFRNELTSLRAYRELRKEWYNRPGLLIEQGKEWHDLRSKTQPHIMKPKAILTYLTSMHDISKDMVQRIFFLRDGKQEVEDLLPELYKWALESVAFVGLDTRLGCLDQNLHPDPESVELINAVQTTFDCMTTMEISGVPLLWKTLRTPTWKRFVKASDVFTRTAMKYINRALEGIKEDKGEDKELTLLQAMLSTPGLDVSGAMTTVMDMLMAGIDTTSHTEGFILYNLAKNPDKQEKLYDEIKKVLPSPSDKLSSSALNELRFLKACIKESIRLYPIARGTLRILDHDIVLGGYRIPAGVGIFFMVQVICRLERYFKNANQFIPERWLDKENKPHPFLYLPFGFGPRSCIGRRLAEQEIICLTTEIIRNFKVEYHYEDIDMRTGLINTPDKPLRFRFIERL